MVPAETGLQPSLAAADPAFSSMRSVLCVGRYQVPRQEGCSTGRSRWRSL
jgi:hypothetical protein